MARTSSSELARLIGLLGLTDEETLEIFAVDPLSLISGELDHRPELPILVVLADVAAQAAGEAGLRRWMRVAGPAGRPVELLVAGDFAGFEDALATLADRGLVVRSSASLGQTDARSPGGDAGPTGGPSPAD
ncbi:MAG TPA: hypothetical protein VG165_07275 [Solirubrobacteraceae bacterium]|nr:hypothetical protein [Solirubrobacteraceae bacterium]